MEQVTQPAGFTMAEVNTAIASLKRSQLRTVSEIGKVLVMACYAAIVGIPESDKEDAKRDYVGVANTLIANLNKSTKRSAIVCFLEQYAPIFVGKSGKFEHFNKTETPMVWDTDTVKAIKVASLTWESLRDDPEEKDFDVEAKARAIITAAAKRQKAGKPVKHEALLANLVAALAAFSAAQIDAELQGAPVEA